MLASTTSSSRARTSVAVPRASSSSVGSSGRAPAGGRTASPAANPLLRNHALNQPYERWLEMMWPSVCRTVHSPPPGSASQSAAASPASAPCSSQRATAVASSAGIAGPTGEPDPPAAAAAGDRRDRRLQDLRGRDRARSGHRARRCRTAASASDARARRRGSRAGRRRCAASGPRAAMTAGWSGTAGTVASSVKRVAHRPSVSPVG